MGAWQIDGFRGGRHPQTERVETKDAPIASRGPTLVAMTFRVVLEHDPETGDYSAVCPELPGCASAGETEEEARANIREAIELYLEPSDLELHENAKLAEVTVG